MRRLNGPLLMATGVLDLLYVLVFHSPQLAAIAGDGFFNAVELDPAQFDRETAFWHVAFGTTVLILGGLVYWVQPGRAYTLGTSTAGINTPVQVSNLSAVKAIAGGGQHSLAGQ
jgi:hypothetical protein